MLIRPRDAVGIALRSLASLAVASVAARPARACGGLFCNRSTVTVPPAQSSERIVFVQNPDGWAVPPEGLWENAHPSDGAPDGGATDAGPPDAGVLASPPPWAGPSV